MCSCADLGSAKRNDLFYFWLTEVSAMVSEGNSSNGSDADDDSRPPRIVFLALIMLVSCVANVFLLYAIFQSRKISLNVQSIIIMNLVAVCLGDCLLNMSLVMGSLAAVDWGFVNALCKWHAFAMNLILVETVLLLTVLACDRFLAVKYLQKYDSLISPARVAFVIIFTWSQSLAFSIPFFFNTVEMTFRPKLHTCSVSDETPLAFICLASVLCFLAPAVLIIIMFILILHFNCKQQHEVKTIITQNHYTDQLMEEPRLWQEMLTVKYVGVLCLLWFILEIPYVITTYIQQYRFSSELNFSVDYPWGVDVAFIWMRFSFSALFPCATFIWKKDLWQCCKDCVICHRNNSVLDIQVKVNPTSKPASVKELPLTAASNSKDRNQPRPEPPNQLCFNVPVLFATSDGMHIETPHSDVSDDDNTDAESRERTLKGRQLDVGDQNINSVQLPGDTSDYDSITEAGYSSSQPLSARHIRGALETNSLPDLRSGEQNERETVSTCVGDFAGTPGVDSGLELSGTAGSLRGKGIQRLVNSSQQCDETDVQNCDSAHVISESSIPRTKKRRKENPVQIANPYSDTDAFRTDQSSGNHLDKCDANSMESSPAVQHSAPSTLPKARGRLKPLNPSKTRKAVKDGAGRKKNAVKSDLQKSESACDVVLTTSISSDEHNGAEIDYVSKTGAAKKPDVVKSSGEGRGRGHKRTVTSDSEKALLGSNSSVEMQILKTHSFDKVSGDK